MSTHDVNRPLVRGERIYLRRLHSLDKNQRYLDWLNNPEVQKYTRFHARTVTIDELDNFLQLVKFTHDVHCAIIVLADNQHIGNIALNSLDEFNKKAHVSVMIGEQSAWSEGYVEEAVRLISQLAFDTLGLHRLWAETPHPKFNEVLERLGWMHESYAREAFNIDGRFVDHSRWALLEHEWRSVSEKND
ncbi:MAG: hypothetical protein A2666_02310 [Parcubacteria group bacterium RIFCSPHIGHO2_01_FULL_47_10b]|nr:MAG: hypothetical protein A2666_02310 [Parcubacteria group bacterium RIFCSPHIGHO2_01_FULL_47_10b]